MNLLLTVAIAGVGSVLFYKLKVPAGALIGALVFSALFNMFTEAGELPAFTKTAVQAASGAFIGQRISRRDLTELKSMLGAGVVMLGCMILYTLFTGRVLSAVTNMDTATSLVAAMPAGLSDTAIISSDLGADPVQCTAISLVRTIFSLTILPQLAFRVCGRINSGKVNSEQKIEPAKEVSTVPQKKSRIQQVIMTLILAQAAGILGKYSGIPAGAMTFSVLAVAFYNIRTERAYLPQSLRLIAQSLTGVVVGVKVTMQDVENIRNLLIPVLILTVSLIICNYLCGFLLYRLCKLDISTSLFGSIPAGVSDMALIAADMGGDSPKIAVLQLVRYVGLISIMPMVIRLIAR